jgi:hypothetical protein
MFNFNIILTSILLCQELSSKTAYAFNTFPMCAERYVTEQNRVSEVIHKHGINIHSRKPSHYTGRQMNKPVYQQHKFRT